MLLCCVLLPWMGQACGVEPRLLAVAKQGVRGLEPSTGQRRIRLAPLDDGRVIAMYTLGYPAGCALFTPCRKQGQVWHMVLDSRGIVVPPRQTVPDLDARRDFNSLQYISMNGARYADGMSAVFGLGHSSHNENGGRFVFVDREGRVLRQGGGHGAYQAEVCPVGRDIIVSTPFVDPVTIGYQWYDRGETLAATVNLGGYGYNYEGNQSLTCGHSPALGGPFGLLALLQPKSHLGLSLYRIVGNRFILVSPEVRVPRAPLRAPRVVRELSVATGDDLGVAVFDETMTDGRQNIAYVRFRLTAKGIELLDRRPQPIAVSPDYEALDAGVTYGGKGRFNLAVYQAGESASGQPANHRQAVRKYSLEAASGGLSEIANYEDARWSGQPPLSFYADSFNGAAFSLVVSCEGTLYVGGAIDGGKGPSVLRIWGMPVAAPSCARSQRLR
ncbi:MAG: hypothetical protein RLZZ393_1916 [Pseudomonadota bacterium]|jgi:hypothetical protein